MKLKRPYLIYLIVLLQCGVIIGLGAIFLGVAGETNVLVREIGSQIIEEQLAMRQDVELLTDTMDSQRVVEECAPTSDVWSVYEDKMDHPAVCEIKRYERKLQQYTCRNSVTGEVTRLVNQIIQDWAHISSTTRTDKPCLTQ